MKKPIRKRLARLARRNRSARYRFAAAIRRHCKTPCFYVMGALPAMEIVGRVSIKIVGFDEAADWPLPSSENNPDSIALFKGVKS